MLNIQGQTIRAIHNAGIRTTMKLGRLTSGVYIIKATTDKGIAITKFVKQ